MGEEICGGGDMRGRYVEVEIQGGEDMRGGDKSGAICAEAGLSSLPYFARTHQYFSCHNVGINKLLSVS